MKYRAEKKLIQDKIARAKHVLKSNELSGYYESMLRVSTVQLVRLKAARKLKKKLKKEAKVKQ